MIHSALPTLFFPPGCSRAAGRRPRGKARILSQENALIAGTRVKRSLLRRLGATLLLSGLGVLLLAACGNDPHPRPIRDVRADGAPWRVMYSSLSDDPRTLDPQVSYDTLSNAIVANVYESLLEYHLFKTDPYELSPCLAEAMPGRTRHADGSESYLFRLKRGIYFHDDPCFPGGKGREVTAADYVYTFHRIADPKVECPVLSALGEYLPGLTQAYEEARKTGSFDYSRPLACIEAVDPYTVRINLSRPYPQILYWFAMPFTAPVPREAVEHYDGKWHEGEGVRDQFKFHPVGTGAFRLAEWNRNRLLRLVRNERYGATQFPGEGWAPGDEARFRPLAGQALPMLDEVQFAFIRESIPRWLLFRQGYMDRSGISKDVFNTVLTAGQELTEKYRERGVKLYKDVEPASYYGVFNMEDPVVGKNKKLRQAISTAYDQERSNEIFRNGIDLRARQILPPGVAGHQPDFPNPYIGHDLPRARQLLREAGYPDGRDAATGQQLELTLDLVGDSAEARQHAEFEKGQFEQLGIRIRLEQNTWARLLEKMERGQFQIYGSSGWAADYPDPENFFALFYSKNFSPQGANHSRYSNPEFDRLFETMRTMDPSPERLAIIAQMNAMLVEDCPFILMSHPVVFSLSQPWTPRIMANSMVSNGLKYTQIDPVLRAARREEWNKVTVWPLWLAIGMAAVGGGSAIAWARRRNV